LTVASNGNETVAPGETDAQLTFTLTNTGNDTQGYDLSLVNEASGDEFDATGLTISYYVGNSATGTELTYTPGTSTVDVPADGQLFIVVSGDIPTAPAISDNDTADISLVADTVEPGSVGAASISVLADSDGRSLSSRILTAVTMLPARQKTSLPTAAARATKPQIKATIPPRVLISLPLPT